MTVITTSNQSNIFSQFFLVCINESNILLQFGYTGVTLLKVISKMFLFSDMAGLQKNERLSHFHVLNSTVSGVSLCSIHVYNSSYSLWNQRSIFQARNRWISNRTLHNSIRYDRILFHMDFIETKHKKEGN